jgi:hypothetical protein
LLPTLVGRGSVAALCIKEMNARPVGYRVIGVIENGKMEDDDAPRLFEGVPVIGDLERLPDIIREARASEVIITDTHISGDGLFEVMMRCGRTRKVEFRIAPSLFNFLPSKTEIDQIGALPMIRLSASRCRMPRASSNAPLIFCLGAGANPLCAAVVHRRRAD